MIVRLPLLWLLLIAPLSAGEVLNVSVERFDRRYVVEVDARFDTQAERLRALLTDYPNLGKINDSIYHSEVLQTHSPLDHRVRTEAKVCVALLCKNIVQIQDVGVLSDGNISATLIPQGSDLSYGVARWQFWTETDGVRMLFRSEIEPAFWVPPIIGPWLIRHALHAEAVKSVGNLDRLAVATP